ncbi:hypothetical protein [uncultured Clostridium sp.]|uniref:hypothetical protein n=1 Tax=uncultured Clostridium sp. TaxID=59620 RepID=UPI0028E5FCA7|nr:hypothetical protein [uncultured Clostridium sp.]
MIVSKEEFKELKKESGGLKGVECMVVATLLSGINELNKKSGGTLEVRSNGLLFDIIMGKKVFIPIYKIDSVNVANGAIEFNIKDDINTNRIIFSVAKEDDLNNLYNTIMGRLGLLGVENLKSVKEMNTKTDIQDDQIRCPKCSSTQVHVQRKGIGVGKTAVGGMLAGPMGLLAGGIGKNKIELTCLRCGHKFQPGKK